MDSHILDYYMLAGEPSAMLLGFKAAAEQAGIVIQGDKVLAWQTMESKVAGGATPTAFAFFNGQEFINPQDEHMLIVGVRFLSGVNATLNATDWIPGCGTALEKNGNWNLTINGTRALGGAINTSRALPTSIFQRAVEEPYSGIVWLPRAPFWVGQQTLQIDMSFPTALAANTNINMQLIGLKAI